MFKTRQLFSIIFICITFIIIFSTKNIAYADQLSNTQNPLPLQMLQIDPIISDLHLIPGQDAVVPLTIKNLSSQPLGIHAQVNDVSEKKSPLVTWTYMDVSDIIMGAQEKKTISITIHTPLHTPNSGYAEIVYLTPFVSHPLQKEAPLILSRIGALIFGTVGKLNYDDLAQKVSITSFSPSARIVDHAPSSLIFRIENTYFTYFTAKPFVTITPLFGKPETVLLDEHHILPGTTRDWISTITPSAYHFIYFAHLAVSIGNGKQLFADTFFIIFPYKPLLVLLSSILFFGIFLLLYHKRRRLNKALRILVKGN